MFKLYTAALSILLLSSNAFAQWELLNTESMVNYVSTKTSSVGEVNSFKTLEGIIDKDGKASVGIDLSSVETNIAIRDDRLKSLLFEVSSFAKATISTTLKPEALDALEVGTTYNDSVDFDVSLHGVSKVLAADVQVVKLSKNKVLVFSMKPMIVNAEQFNLTEGISKLREAAGLSSISTAVPVTFNLVFEQQK